MWKKLILIAVFLIFAVQAVSAATIHGTVYDLYLDKTDAIVTINTIPEQTYVVKNGTYSFQLNTGTYELKAEYFEVGALISSVEENITITEEGDYVVDLILFPDFSEEEKILDEADMDIGEEILEEETILAKLIWGGLFGLLIKAIVIFIVIIFLIIGARKVYKYIKKESDEIDKDIEKEEIDEIIDYIKSEGGRVTQKNLRKRFMSSQAKMSLILTELEHKGIIEKIKKGRGNIIILKK